MCKLVESLEQGTFDHCRMLLDRQRNRQDNHPNPWVALNQVLDKSRQESDDATPSGWELAAHRLSKNLADAANQKEQTHLRQIIEQRLRDGQDACRLVELTLGNFGLPWPLVRPEFPDKEASFWIRIGTISFLPKDLLAAFPDLSCSIEVPAILPLDNGRPLVVVAPDALRDPVTEGLFAAGIRAMLLAPPGIMHLTLLDPRGLSRGREALSLFKETLVYDAQVMEKRVESLVQHMELMASRGLSKGIDRICEHNQTARANGSACETYHVVVAYDYPAAYSEAARHCLQALARNGPNAGILPLIHWGQAPEDRHAEARLVGFAPNMILIRPDGEGRLVWQEEQLRRGVVRLESLPSQEIIQQIMEPIVAAAQEIRSRKLDFSEIAGSVPIWQTSSATGVRLALGKGLDDGPLYMEIGEDTRQHALLVGGSGSGKSNLLHVLILSAAQQYAPTELQLYLIDFKSVEFKVYSATGLPHVAVMAIDSDREFGINVLRKLKKVMDERYSLFGSGVSDFVGYRNSGESMPRILAIFDEFQDFFRETDDISQEAASLFDELLRKGRGAGIHFILATQSLYGRGLSNSSLGQIQLRIVLKCRVEDSRLALGGYNAEGQSLQLAQVGEGIYNPDGGAPSANKWFRSPYMPPAFRESLCKSIRNHFDQNSHGRSDSEMFVFSGNEPPLFEESAPWKTKLARGWRISSRTPAKVWLGDPIAIDSPIEVRFQQRRGRHLAVISQNIDEGLGILFNSMVALLCQHANGTARFYVINGLQSGTPYVEWPDRLKIESKHNCDIVSGADADTILTEMAGESRRRAQNWDGDQNPWYCFLLGLQNINGLRALKSYGSPESDTPLGALTNVICEGAEHGLHVLLWCDMLANFSRSLRGMTEEFGVRVAGHMSQTDSLAFIASSSASRLTKTNRAVLLDDANPAHTRVFRPYRTPNAEVVAKLFKG